MHKFQFVRFVSVFQDLVHSQAVFGKMTNFLSFKQYQELINNDFLNISNMVICFCKTRMYNFNFFYENKNNIREFVSSGSAEHY